MNTKRVLVYTAAILMAIYSLAPVYSIVNISLMSVKDIVGSQVFPVNPTLNEYFRIVGYNVVGHYGPELAFGQATGLKQGLINILIIAPLVTVITIAACTPAGYALGRMNIKGRTGLVGLLLGSRPLPPVSVALPYYFLFSAIGLKGTIPGIVIVHLSITIPIVAWILMGFFAALPRDLELAARVDGCSRLGAFRRALLPLAAPGIAASAVISFLFSWNDFFFSWLLSGGTPAQTYNSFLSSFFNFQSEPGMFAAAVVIQMLVAIVVAAFLQKYITSLKIVDPGSVVIG
jgi:multiple sugar transport system permease protein